MPDRDRRGTLKVNLAMCFLVALTVAVLASGPGRDAATPKAAGKESSAVIPPNEPQAKGDRLFGINIAESDRGFGPSFEVAQLAGIQLIELNIPWNAIEVAEGQYQDPWGVLSAIPFYGGHNVQVLFSLAVINTVESTVPAYLRDRAWDAPEMIEAFNHMADWFLAHVPANVTVPGLAIGNEVDLVLTGGTWQAYSRFFQATRRHVRAVRPGLKVGVKTTVTEGVLGKWAEQVKAINEHADVVMLNYYPQDPGFRVLPPDAVHGHFDRIVRFFGDRTIWFTEIGYQSGAAHCGSSEARQALFYHHLFSAWDRHRERIGLILINWLHDQSPETIAGFTEYYGSSAPAFVEFLSTLGLRRYNHTDKAAWPQVLAETAARGW
jgi:hypothetical protein